MCLFYLFYLFVWSLFLWIFPVFLPTKTGSVIVGLRPIVVVSPILPSVLLSSFILSSSYSSISGCTSSTLALRWWNTKKMYRQIASEVSVYPSPNEYPFFSFFLPASCASVVGSPVSFPLLFCPLFVLCVSAKRNKVYDVSSTATAQTPTTPSVLCFLCETV